MVTTQLALDFAVTADPLATFIERAAGNSEAVKAAQNWVNRRGGSLMMTDIRQLRAALRNVEGYSSELAGQHVDFLDVVAYGITNG